MREIFFIVYPVGGNQITWKPALNESEFPCEKCKNNAQGEVIKQGRQRCYYISFCHHLSSTQLSNAWHRGEETPSADLLISGKLYKEKQLLSLLEITEVLSSNNSLSFACLGYTRTYTLLLSLLREPWKPLFLEFGLGDEVSLNLMSSQLFPVVTVSTKSINFPIFVFHASIISDTPDWIRKIFLLVSLSNLTSKCIYIQVYIFTYMYI